MQKKEEIKKSIIGEKKKTLSKKERTNRTKK